MTESYNEGYSHDSLQNPLALAHHAGFAGQLAWGVENQYFNTFIYDNITPDPRPISWMVAASAFTATLTTILMGAFSDQVRSSWGRRKPFILLGYLAWGVSDRGLPISSLSSTRGARDRHCHRFRLHDDLFWFNSE